MVQLIGSVHSHLEFDSHNFKIKKHGRFTLEHLHVNHDSNKKLTSKVDYFTQCDPLQHEGTHSQGLISRVNVK